MKHKGQGRRSSGRLAVLIAVLTAAFMLTMPAAAATCTASDVMIRNSGEEKDGNIIGVLNEGDQVTVVSKSTDAAGIEWYYVRLPNGNTGYVKSQWIDNGGDAVETVQPETEPAREDTQQEETEAQEPADDAFLPGEDDWDRGQTQTDDGTAEAVEDTGSAKDDGSSENVADGQAAPAVDGGTAYDPYTDPNAQYSINFVTEKDGTGSWYIYNYDTDKRIRIGDLEKLSDAETAAKKSASSAGIWRTIACILLILVVALLIFLYTALHRGGSGRGNTPSARRQRRRAPSYDEDEEEEDEFADLREDSPAAFGREEGKSAPDGDSRDRRAKSDPDVSAADFARDEESEETEEDFTGESAEDFDSGNGEEDPEERPAPRRAFGFLGGRDRGRRESGEDYEDDGEYDGEEDDDYIEDDGYDEFDEDDGEEETPRRGGLLGVLKNIFSPEGLDDDYDDEDEEDSEEEDPEEDPEEDGSYEDEEEKELPFARRGRGSRRTGSRSAGREAAPRPRPRRARKIEFDEAADYPEDADLLAAAGAAGSDADTADRAEPEKKTAAAAPQADRSAAAPAGEDTEGPNDEEFYADDDDDMEYSFLNSSPRRGRRR